MPKGIKNPEIHINIDNTGKHGKPEFYVSGNEAYAVVAAYKAIVDLLKEVK